MVAKKTKDRVTLKNGSCNLEKNTMMCKVRLMKLVVRFTGWTLWSIRFGINFSNYESISTFW